MEKKVSTQGQMFLCKQQMWKEQNWRQLMKRRIISTVTICVLLVLVLAVRLSDREKNDNSIPSKETVAAYILEKGEQYAAERLRAQDRDSLRHSWGDPDAMPSGIWADVWDLDADTTILVFYPDGKQCVMHLTRASRQRWAARCRRSNSMWQICCKKPDWKTNFSLPWQSATPS